MRAVRRLVYAVVAGSLLVAAGCGGSSAKQNGEDKKSAQQILSDVQQALSSASSVHVTGHVTVPGAGDVQLDLHMSGPTTGKGTVKVKGQPFDVVRVGKDIYLKASAAAYAASGIPATEGALIADRWIKAPAEAAQFKQLSGFIGLQPIAGILAPTGTLQKGPKKSIDGTPTVGLQDVVNGRVNGTAYISLVGKPYPLRVDGTSKAGASGRVDFKDWDKPVTVNAPSGAFDVSKFLTG